MIIEAILGKRDKEDGRCISIEESDLTKIIEIVSGLGDNLPSTHCANSKDIGKIELAKFPSDYIYLFCKINDPQKLYHLLSVNRYVLANSRITTGFLQF